MQQIRIGAITLIKILIFAGIGYLVGLLIDKPMLGAVISLGLLSFWHIFSSIWLNYRINHPEAKGFSFLPLSDGDSRACPY